MTSYYDPPAAPEREDRSRPELDGPAYSQGFEPNERSGVHGSGPSGNAGVEASRPGRRIGGDGQRALGAPSELSAR